MCQSSTAAHCCGPHSTFEAIELHQFVSIKKAYFSTQNNSCNHFKGFCLSYFFFLFMCLLHDSPFTVGKQYILFAQASGRAMMLGGKACKYQRRPKHSRQGECSTTSFSSDSRSTRTVICPPPPSTAIPCV